MFWKMIYRQMTQKWPMTTMLFAMMAMLVALYVFIMNTNRFANRSMQLIMKNMGLNQILMPAQENPLDVYLCTKHQQLFPEAVADTLAKHTELLSKYYVALLQQRIELDGVEVVISGIRPVKRVDETAEKAGMIKPVPPGQVRLGHVAARRLGREPGDVLNIHNESFQVERIFPERGTLDDCRVYLALDSAQRIFGAKDQVNAILSFECLHVGGSLEEIHNYQHGKLQDILPGYRQYNISSVAEGRYHARKTTRKYLRYVIGTISIIAILAIAINGFQDVSERRYETGVLISMGAGYGYVASLYLVKILFVATLASVVGFVVGGYLSVWLTSPFLVTNTRHISILWTQLPKTVLISGFVALLGQLPPIIKLVRMDPCTLLTED